MVKLCIRGHEKTPENVKKNGTCKLCSAITHKLLYINNTPCKNGKIEDGHIRDKFGNCIACRKAAGRKCYSTERGQKKAKDYYRNTYVPRPRKLKTEEEKRERRLQGAKLFREENREKLKEKSRNIVQRLTTGYVAMQIGIHARMLTPEILEIKRQTIKLWRALK